MLYEITLPSGRKHITDTSRGRTLMVLSQIFLMTKGPKDLEVLAGWMANEIKPVVPHACYRGWKPWQPPKTYTLEEILDEL